MGKLDGKGVEALSRRLSETLSPFDLEIYVYSSTGNQLFVDYVAPGRPLRPTIAELLTALDREGTLDLFLSKVYLERPLRQDVREAIAAVVPEVAELLRSAQPVLVYQIGGGEQGQAPVAAQAPGLQRIVNAALPTKDIEVWLQRADTVKRQVCRIQFDGAAAGTGFLVGPAAVLTNWHVVEAAVANGEVAALSCTFGYVARADGTREAGVDVAVNAVADSSPYAPAETTAHPDQPEPSADELDYALLLLANPVGSEAFKDSPARGWMNLSEAAPVQAAGAPLVIVQHPDGAPMKLALDTNAVIGHFGSGRRLRYRTNTDPGSSGSPCLDLDWNLVALHHFGDPAWQKPQFNQGVPIALIAQRLRARGHGGLLVAA